MINTIRYFTPLFLITCSLWLSSCAITCFNSPPAAVTSREVRVKQLSAIHSWNFKGIIAIRTVTEAESANLHWQQNKQNYILFLFGPLGLHHFKIKGSLNKVILEDSQGNQFTAHTAQELLRQRTGWDLPLPYLQYWILGLPVPGIKSVQQLDICNRLLELQQSGWKIHYLSYMTSPYGDLPKKLLLEHPALKVKLIIHQWQ